MKVGELVRESKEFVVESPSKGTFKTLVDAEDYDKILEANIKWRVDSPSTRPRYGPYIVGHHRELKRDVKLHRWLIDASADKQVDHINGDTLDNRRCNLRLVTKKQNQANKRCNYNNALGYKGVRRSGKKYSARLYQRPSGERAKEIYLGTFSTPEEAAMAYDKKAIEIYGPEYARLNFPQNEGIKNESR